MGDKITVLYDCHDCPCLNIDQEEPADCNLGYTIQSKRIPGAGWHHVSSDCQLLEIRTVSKKIVPALIKFEGTSKEIAPPCDHEFFKCQVPGGDSCVAIYHQVCRKCRWDKRKGIFMPPNIWHGWALPQLEKLDNRRGGQNE